MSAGGLGFWQLNGWGALQSTGVQEDEQDKEEDEPRVGHGERCPGPTLGDRSVRSGSSRARAEGKENLLRASHQSCLEGGGGRDKEAKAFPRLNEETGRWSLESAIMFQNLILTVISGDIVHHLLCTPGGQAQRGQGRPRSQQVHSRAWIRCQGPSAPPQKEGSRVPHSCRLPWNIGGQPGSQRAGYSFPRAHTLAHPGCGAAEEPEKSLGGRRASTGLNLWPWQVFCPCVVDPRSCVPQLQVATAEEDSQAWAGRDAQCPRAWAGLTAEGCSCSCGSPGPSAAPSRFCAWSVGRVADGVDLLQPWGRSRQARWWEKVSEKENLPW